MASQHVKSHSAVALNFYGYRIVNNDTHETPENVTASFKYRGYEVAMTTFNPAGSKVVILLNKVLVDECNTVEAAIKAIDGLLNWRGVDRRQRPQQGRWRAS